LQVDNPYYLFDSQKVNMVYIDVSNHSKKGGGSMGGFLGYYNIDDNKDTRPFKRGVTEGFDAVVRRGALRDYSNLLRDLFHLLDNGSHIQAADIAKIEQVQNEIKKYEPDFIGMQQLYLFVENFDELTVRDRHASEEIILGQLKSNYARKLERASEEKIRQARVDIIFELVVYGSLTQEVLAFIDEQVEELNLPNYEALGFEKDFTEEIENFSNEINRVQYLKDALASIRDGKSSFEHFTTDILIDFIREQDDILTAKECLQIIYVLSERSEHDGETLGFILQVIRRHPKVIKFEDLSSTLLKRFLVCFDELEGTQKESKAIVNALTNRVQPNIIGLVRDKLGINKNS